ncbi:riboflavin synthase [Anabaena cylindrica UHCC 0172]|uniref:riboflavin synthase n=1 Tax=Anabaena cylindrica TaxID=1165 RepID=UPI002B1FE603|nr:riboflavin synthase [Anabaena cylindrica]MEA5553998.1 riboflavin synthase [Anabaena cylindrica UHCC 0172]
MFTGLIQGLGTIKPLENDFWQITFVSKSDTIMADLTYGDSVAVDGICLTVEEILKDGFIATASPETLSRTTLEREETQARYVNIETSLRVGGKVGGHFVMGHVDGIGELISVEQTASSWEMTFAASAECDRYIVPKGSIAVNGISLTIATYQPEHSHFTVAVIPVTYTETNLNYLVPGSYVNLEGDILGKYVEKFLSPGQKHHQEDVTPAFLAEHGYL